MKKIAILAFGDKYEGGVFQYTQSLIDSLKEDAGNYYIIFCNEIDHRFDYCGLEVRKLDKPKTNLLKKIVMAFQCLFILRKPLFFTKINKNIFQDIDLFLSPGVSLYPHFYLDKPFIFTLHDMQEKYYPNFFPKFERLIRWLNNRALANTAIEILCESTFVESDIVRFLGVDRARINVIQSPPPKSLLGYKSDALKFKAVQQKYNLPDKYIFYPAQCWFHKNHIRLVEAFDIVRKQVDDVELVLTGSQQDNYCNLVSKIEHLGLTDKVTHLGYVDYEDLPYLYKMSHFLVMPTLFESVSLPIYEAFSLKVPVCCSNVVGLPEQVGDAALIFDPHNVNDIAEKMLMYLENNLLCQNKANKGFIRVDNFSHDKYRQKLLEVINRY